MSISRKIFLAVMALNLLVVFGAKAEESEQKQATSDVGAILFRIENIEPITNNDGLTDQCSYMMTVYNRMDKALKNADIVLSWKDKYADKYKVKDGELKVALPQDAVRIITNEVSIDNVAPHTQKSFAQKVSTDRCYLLLDNVEFKVTSCTMDSAKKEDRCDGKFNYIDSKNPEYYSEFKDVPESVLAQQVEEEKERELSKVNETVGSILETMDATEKELEKIK